MYSAFLGTGLCLRGFLGCWASLVIHSGPAIPGRMLCVCEEKGCFVGDFTDAGLHFYTPVDPLFLALLVLDANRCQVMPTAPFPPSLASTFLKRVSCERPVIIPACHHLTRRARHALDHVSCERPVIVP